MAVPRDRQLLPRAQDLRIRARVGPQGAAGRARGAARAAPAPSRRAGRRG